MTYDFLKKLLGILGILFFVYALTILFLPGTPPYQRQLTGFPTVVMNTLATSSFKGQKLNFYLL